MRLTWKGDMKVHKDTLHSDKHMEGINMANHKLVILKKEVIQADTFLFLFFGVMTLFLIILLSPNQQVGVAQED